MHTRVVLLEQGHPRRSLYQPDGILVLQRLIQHHLRYRHHHPSDSCTESLEPTNKTEEWINTCLYFGRIVSPFFFLFLFPLGRSLAIFNSAVVVTKYDERAWSIFSPSLGPEEIVQINRFTADA
jgi:hypothetical protein